ncbi:YVTN family beta-propeller protein [Kribbella sp. VKM Ac-2527]|uniref:YVTN family beta-propeller protein n=1 Tax=Kribbella caucasensis TaxID=2512215 RepID=A0A4R6KBE6_9ACTN|nr:Hsp70 family protein [Kribbella sp. VKM Ac-2527]TDO47266.1 YVTN family beta-propeller protein [Kribbella sp. VKM Ac-2527]
MGYRLAVDLGTTFTAAASSGDGGAPVMLGLGNRALQVPSVLYLQEDGEFLVGEAAERHVGDDPSRLVREFKRRLGDPVPLLVAGKPFSAQALLAKMLSWVVARATERLGAPPDEVVLTYPADWGAYKRDLVDQVIALADIGPAITCPEPQAAAIQYAAGAQLATGDRIVIYDLGGGTFDVCVMERADNGFAILGTPEGIDQLGGVDFDEAVFQHVVGVLGPAIEELDPDTAEGRTALARLRRDCVEAKEALSADVDTLIHVALPDRSTSVRLTRAELETLIAPVLDQTLQATTRALRTAGTTTDQLTAIVLVGGSSRIPLVSHLLQAEFSTPIALDTHPKHDIAMGAARFEVNPPTTVLPVVPAVEREVAPGTRRAIAIAGAAAAVACVATAVVLLTTGDGDPPQVGTQPTTALSSSQAVKGPGLYGLAVSSTGTTAYLSTLSASSATAVDLKTGKLSSIRVGSQPLGMAVGGGHVYVVNHGPGTVTRLDEKTFEPVDSIQVGRLPQSIVIDPGDGTGYVTNTSDDTVSVIEEGTVRTLVEVGDWPLNLAIDGTANRLYVVNVVSNSVSVISTTTKKAARPELRVDRRPHAIAVNPADDRLYLTHEGSKSITVVDTEAMEILRRITLEAVPSELAFGGRTLYATLKDTDQVAVIDTGTAQPGVPIAVGDQPVAIAVNPDGNRLYVTSDGSQTLTIINTSTNQPVRPPIAVSR